MPAEAQNFTPLQQHPFGKRNFQTFDTLLTFPQIGKG